MAKWMTGVEREPAPLNIGLLGYDHKLTKRGFKQLIKNNIDQIDEINNHSCIAYYKDGTRIQIVTASQPFRGLMLDQLILFDDSRWNIYQERRDLINQIKDFAMSHSNVPEEFQILEYEDLD